MQFHVRIAMHGVQTLAMIAQRHIDQPSFRAACSRPGPRVTIEQVENVRDLVLGVTAVRSRRYLFRSDKTPSDDRRYIALHCRQKMHPLLS